ncbi:NAD(P)H-dependent flavin oxidoreductase [Legionella maioricensis]|uniref:Nitronate monooxygenase n=1 Tax=Legionella maioricensis TaxID=2896528 RepID=A0A9X2CZX8_9GAMM|nr:nitronate monooxygenase [Legionella maioricensis]MCL9683863.1 nitronate monooxygenase [Legionella maioricensis]MCL9686710.1 nitronate monooxygenase [Legionella maioricensis]
MSHPMLNTPFCKRLGLTWPLIQAPLGGGPSTPALVAAVSNEGALGSLGAAYLPPVDIEQTINHIKKLTPRPFGVNLFAPAQPLEINATQVNAALKVTHPFRQELALPEPLIQAPFEESFEEQMAVVLKCKPAVFSFTFGLIDKKIIKECRKQEIMTIGTATTLEEGIALQESGVDAVVVQGIEAGGHRGMFFADQQDSLMGTFILTRIMTHTLQIPVISSGGIMDGRSIAAVLTLGAQAAQLGTAFLLCDEAGTTPAYREALHHAQGNTTQLTRAFSGRWARGIKNRFMIEMEKQERSILPFPAQNAFTRDIRKKAAELGRSEFLSLWAGQGVELIRKMKAKELVQTLGEETLAALCER